MDKLVRKINYYLFALFILYGIYKIAHIDSFLKSPTLNNYIDTILNSNFVTGLCEYFIDKSNAWDILTTIATTLIAILSLFFLFKRLRKQDKLVKETISSNTANRFRDAINLLQSENDSVIIGAIFLLDRLAREQPKIYAKLVIEIFCGYLRNESIKRLDTEESFPLKFQTIIDCLFKRGNILKDFVYTDNYNIINLEGSNLSFANFNKGDLSGIHFFKTNLNYADFSNASLSISKFNDVKIRGADFNKAFLIYSEFVNTDLNEVKNLDESRQLDTVKFNGDTPEFVKKILENNYKYTYEKMHSIDLSRLKKLFKKKSKKSSA